MTSPSDDILTPQEHHVMELVARGENDGQIAHTLGLAPQTVTHYVRSTRLKLSARNRTAAAVQYYLRYGRPETGARQQPAREPLSPQESRVIELAAHGSSEPEIAARLGIAPSTVKHHLARVRQKLGAPNRPAAAVEYYRQVVAVSYMKKPGSGEAD